MKSENLQTRQVILTEDLQRLQSTKEEAIRERLMDYSTPGVLWDTVFDDYKNLVPGEPFKIESYGDYAIKVGTGIAISPKGERIVIDSYQPYDAANPTMRSDDGIGGTVLTPQSTGNKGIPLAANKTYYIWLGYLAVINRDIYTLKKDSTERIYTQIEDGYEIKVTEEDENPDSDRFIKLGVVTTNSEGKVDTISETAKEIARIKEKRIKIIWPNTEQEKFLDDHIKAVGTGTVSSINPHGLSASDLGIDPVEAIEHQSKLHTSGIATPDPNRTDSALYMHVEVQTATNEDFVTIYGLKTDDEIVLINGYLVRRIKDINENTNTIIFNFLDETGNPLPEGYYLFLLKQTLDKNIAEIIRIGPKNTEAEFDDYSYYLKNNQLPLWSIEWKETEVPGQYNLTSQKDWRIFGTTSNKNIQKPENYSIQGYLDIEKLSDNPKIQTVPNVAPKGKSRLFYDKTRNKLMLSENESIFEPIKIEPIRWTVQGTLQKQIDFPVVQSLVTKSGKIKRVIVFVDDRPIDHLNYKGYGVQIDITKNGKGDNFSNSIFAIRPKIKSDITLGNAKDYDGAMNAYIITVTESSQGDSNAEGRIDPEKNSVETGDRLQLWITDVGSGTGPTDPGGNDLLVTVEIE